MRHAKAERGDARTPDFDRPLSERGRRDAPLVGERLLRLGIVPEDLVTSPARRALETAELLADVLGVPASGVRRDPRIYDAGAGTLLDVVQSTPDRHRSLMLVGHNPGLSELAQELARGFDAELQTCAALVIDLPAEGWEAVRRRAGRVVHLEFPKRVP